jgi:hypothetical protein
MALFDPKLTHTNIFVPGPFPIAWLCAFVVSTDLVSILAIRIELSLHFFLSTLRGIGRNIEGQRLSNNAVYISYECKVFRTLTPRRIDRLYDVSSLIVRFLCQGQFPMHQLRNYFAVKGDFIPLETFGIRHWRCFGTGKVTVYVV